MPVLSQSTKQLLLQQATRRRFFGDCGLGIGKMALASLLVGVGTR